MGGKRRVGEQHALRQSYVAATRFSHADAWDGGSLSTGVIARRAADTSPSCPFISCKHASPLTWAEQPPARRHYNTSSRSMTGGAHMSEAMSKQCLAPPGEPLNLEARLGVPNIKWLGAKF